RREGVAAVGGQADVDEGGADRGGGGAGDVPRDRPGGAGRPGDGGVGGGFREGRAAVHDREPRVGAVDAAPAGVAVADADVEVEGAVGGRQTLAEAGRVVDQARELGEGAGGACGRVERAEQRAGAVVGRGERRRGPQVPLLPVVGQGVAVGVGAGRGQGEG